MTKTTTTFEAVATTEDGKKIIVASGHSVDGAAWRQVHPFIGGMAFGGFKGIVTVTLYKVKRDQRDNELGRIVWNKTRFECDGSGWKYLTNPKPATPADVMAALYGN